MFKRLLCVVLFVPFSYFLHGQCMTVPETLENLLAASPLVVEGKVRSQRGYWDADTKNIYTVNEIEVFKIFQGSILPSTVQVVTLGGVVDLDTDQPAMDRVSSALELQVDEMGLFILQGFPGTLSNNFLSTAPLYRPTEGVLGFIRYDLVIGEAKGVYTNYTNIGSELYALVTDLTGPPVNLGLWDSEDAGLAGEPSIERSIVSEQEGSSNANFEIHAGVGDMLTISGADFGTDQGSVLFPDANSGGNQYIAALPHQIKEWTDTRIVLEVPYRAGTGKVRIDKANGESLIGDENLPIGYDHINVQYTDNSGRKAYETQLTGDNSNGGYDFQFETDFAQNSGAAEAFISLIETWACATGVNFRIGENTNVDEDANDGINIVRFDNGDELGGRTLAYARSRYRGCYQGETIKWYVNEIEVVVNDDYNWYYGQGLPGAGQFDFETVMLHEIGHTQQLGHVINFNEVMHFAVGSGTQKRNLSHIDAVGGEFVTAKSTDEQVCGREVMKHYGECCETLAISGQPVDQTLCKDDVTASFLFEVDFSDTWQWQVQIAEIWTDLTDDSIYTGTATENLSVLRSDRKLQKFRCIASNGCEERLTSVTALMSFRNMDFTMITVPATCESEGKIHLDRKSTEGVFEVSTDGGTTYDTQWPANMPTIDIPVSSGSYNVIVTDTDTTCSVDLGMVILQDHTTLNLSVEVLRNADCAEENGSIQVLFNDHPAQDLAHLSIDGGVTFESFDDTLGTLIFENLNSGTYTVLGMWEDGSCKSTAEAVTIVSISNCQDNPEIPNDLEMPNLPQNPNTPNTPDMPNPTDESSVPETGDPEESIPTTLKLYPNPTTERIYVKNAQGKVVRFQLFSSRGTLVQDVVPQSNNEDTYYMDIAQLQAGVYSLYITTTTTNALRQIVIK